jgi:hypothetical protein
VADIWTAKADQPALNSEIHAVTDRSPNGLGLRSAWRRTGDGQAEGEKSSQGSRLEERHGEQRRWSFILRPHASYTRCTLRGGVSLDQSAHCADRPPADRNISS